MPNGNLSDMTPPTTDEKRASIVHQYLISGLTQDGFCAHLKATQRIQVAPRTLRAWCRRFRPSGKPTLETVRVVADVLNMLQDLLGRLQAGDGETVTCEAIAVAAEVPSRATHPDAASQVAAAPASGSEAHRELSSTPPTEAAGPLPTGMPGGKPHTPIRFMPTEEPPVPEERPTRRKGHVIWEV